MESERRSLYTESLKNSIQAQENCQPQFTAASPELREAMLQQTSKFREVVRSKISGFKVQSLNNLDNLLNSRQSADRRSSSKTIECQICSKQCTSNFDLYIAACQHQFDYCQSCLHEYVIYMVNQFLEVTCPNAICTKFLDMEGSLFKELPIEIQKKYKKVHNFYLTLKNQNEKMCPGGECEGIIRNQGNEMSIMVCNQCKRRFCSGCLMRQHEGECDAYELLFYEKNLFYKRCPNCKMVIEKDEGCNHMVCICKCQFCYVCGAKWDAVHFRVHDQNGRPIILQEDRRQQRHQVIRQQINQVRRQEQEAHRQEYCANFSFGCTFLFIFVKSPLILCLAILILIIGLIGSATILISLPCFCGCKKYEKCLADGLWTLFALISELMRDLINC